MIFRVARHTNDLKPLISFYTNILGLEILGEFRNHDNYDGVFLGKQNLNWHLEFTKSLIPVDHKFDMDDILVFYPEQIIEYDNIIDRINNNGLKIVNHVTPYWRNNGVMIKDPDGYCIIISNQKLK